MRSTSSRIGKLALALTTSLGLAFGASQAFAAPSAAGTRLACDFITCDQACIAKGYSAGDCTYKGVCRCYP
jgi:hypothetical protein